MTIKIKTNELRTITTADNLYKNLFYYTMYSIGCFNLVYWIRMEGAETTL